MDVTDGYTYVVYSPCGNDTALVLGDQYTSAERVEIGARIMAERKNVEQVGFLSMDCHRLTMAGGEFCGNAVRCAAYHYLNGNPGELEIEICGDKIKAGVNLDGGVWVEVPNPQVTKIMEGVHLCRMSGINHIVVTEENKDALGVIFYKAGKINPVVYVPSAGTCFNETACLSGTAAAAAVLWNESNQMSIEQPSGKFLRAIAERDGGVIRITGEVVKLYDDKNNEPFVAFQGQYVRKTVAEMLEKVQEQIPNLILYEGWRSYEKQTAMFEKQHKVNATSFPELNDAELDAYTHNQVAIPSRDTKNPSPHATGGAVDVGIGGLDFGCDYLEMCEATITDCEGISETAKKNRRLLLEAMTAAGFVNFPYEWWHFEYGIDVWAKAFNSPALYDGVFDLCNHLRKKETP